MKKVLLSAFMMLFLLASVKAQDLITTKDGKDIQAKILEVTNTEVKYKKFNNQDGPTFTMNKSEILIVRYQNGENEVFSNNSSQYSSTPYISTAKGPIQEGMRYKEYKNLYDHHLYNAQIGDQYSPGWSGVASFFIPGLGQAICGEWGRGLAYFGSSVLVSSVGGIVTALTYSYWPMLVTTAAALTIDIMSIVDAVHVAKIKNMYYQDLRGQHANINFGLSPYLTYTNFTGETNAVVGLSINLNF